MIRENLRIFSPKARECFTVNRSKDEATDTSAADVQRPVNPIRSKPNRNDFISYPTLKHQIYFFDRRFDRKRCVEVAFKGAEDFGSKSIEESSLRRTNNIGLSANWSE
jgi:hypothetical protein